MRKIILPVLLLLVVAGGVYWEWLKPEGAGREGIILHGNVDVRQIALAFDVNGRILDLRAEEGDAVRKGDVLGKLDTRILELQARQAEAQAEAQRQALLKIRNGARPEELAQARARLRSAEAAARRAEADLARVSRLQGSGSASAQAADHARSEAEAARAQVAETEAALKLLEEGPRIEDLAAAEAQLAAAEAALATFRFQIGQGTLHAPADAVVRSRLLEPGDQAGPQRPVYALAVNRPKWIRVYVSEPDLNRIAPGMEAEIVTDGDPGASFDGRVGYISSVAEFTPRTVQTEELRTSLVYEVRVVVEDGADRLRLGQPVTVRLQAESLP
jgi:HlyD family secretion protein